MPSLTLETLQQLKSDYKDYPYFVETGTFRGDTVRNMASEFKELHTIEVKPEFNKNAMERSKHLTNIKFHLGDSGVMLNEVVSNLPGNTVFFLDGHYSSGDTGRGTKDCPLVEEFETIMKLFPHQGIIIVDDYRLFGIKANEDWSDITTNALLNVLGGRVAFHYTLPSTIAVEDRLVVHINAI